MSSDNTKLSETEFDLLELSGLSLTGSAMVQNKVSPSEFRREMAYFAPTTSLPQEGQVEITLQPKNLLIGSINAVIGLNACGSATACYKPAWDLVRSVTLFLNERSIKEFTPDQLYFETLFMESAGDIEAVLSAQKRAGYTTFKTSATPFSTLEATNPLVSLAQGVQYVSIQIPNIQRYIRSPLSSYKGLWKIVFDFKPISSVQYATSAGAVGTTAQYLKSLNVWLEGFRVPTKMIRQAHDIIAKGQIYKFIDPTVVRKAYDGSGSMVASFPNIRGRISQIYFWFEHGNKYKNSGVGGNPDAILDMHTGLYSTSNIQIGTPANPNLLTQRPINLGEIVNRTQMSNGLLPRLDSFPTTAVDNQDATKNSVTWSYKELPIYSWSLCDSDVLSYQEGISNGSVEAINDLQIEFSGLQAVAGTLVVLFYTRRGIKYTNGAIDGSVQAVELDSLKVEMR